MIKIKILNWQKPSTKIIITVFSALFILSGYFIVYINYTFLRDSETHTLDRLAAIANTLAPQIDGDAHQRLSAKYKVPGLLTNNNSDPDYKKIFKVVRAAYDNNHLESEISTLVWVPGSGKFHYIVCSLDSPYIGDPYERFHSEFMYAYTKDTVIHKYSDEFGTFLTAIAPIRNSANQPVGILEIDEKFDTFIVEARKGLYKNLAISVLIFIVTVIVLLRYIRIIMVAEEKSKQKIEESSLIISAKNKDILDSINYARRIQNAILAPREQVFSIFKNAFILYKPKDIVSGDFYYFTKTKNRAIIAVADCTGHGVPGALMSMIGNDMLHQITREMKIEKPSEILDNLHHGVTNVLNQSNHGEQTKDGMDIALLSFDYEFKNLQFAGAYRPLYVARNGELTEYKANKFPIGNTQQDRSNFNNNEIELKKGDMCYIFTDGYADQFGGNQGKKFMMKKLKDLLLEISSKSIDEQEKILNDTIENWRGHIEQIDDILVIGVRI